MFTIFHDTKILVIILIKLFINGIGSTSDVCIMKTGPRRHKIHHQFWCILCVNWRYMELFTLNASIFKLSFCFFEKKTQQHFFKLKQGNNFYSSSNLISDKFFSSPDMVLSVSLPRCHGVLQNTPRIMRRLLFSAVLPHMLSALWHKTWLSLIFCLVTLLSRAHPNICKLIFFNIIPCSQNIVLIAQ